MTGRTPPWYFRRPLVPTSPHLYRAGPQLRCGQREDEGMRIIAMIVGFLMLSASADATLCRRKNGLLAFRSGSCRAREKPVSAADIGAAGAQGAEGSPGSEGPQGPAGPGARWALVSGSGAILAQSGGITVVTSTNGAHVLDFGASLAGKVLQATTAYLDSESAGDGRVNVGLCGGGAAGITCDPPANDDHHVFAYTVNAAGTLNEPHPFFIAAF